MKTKSYTPFFKSLNNFIPAMLVILCLGATPAMACSEIWIDTSLVSTRTFDFMSGDGFMRYNPEATPRQAQYNTENTLPMKWTSRYASLTFNTVFPQPTSGMFYAGVDGINEAGLKIGTYYLPTSEFPSTGPETTIDIASLQQYLLDRFESVDQVIADLGSSRYRVTNTPSKEFNIMLHLFVHDTKGHSAIIEFIDGKLKITDNPKIPVLANTDYKTSTTLLKKYKGFGGDLPIPGSEESDDRFVRAAYYRQHLEKPENFSQAINYGLAVIKPVSISPRFIHGCTQWTIVTDLDSQKIFFQTLDSPDTATIDLKKLTTSKAGIREIKLMNTRFTGDISTRFIQK